MSEAREITVSRDRLAELEMQERILRQMERQRTAPMAPSQAIRPGTKVLIVVVVCLTLLMLMGGVVDIVQSMSEAMQAQSQAMIETSRAATATSQSSTAAWDSNPVVLVIVIIGCLLVAIGLSRA